MIKSLPVRFENVRKIPKTVYGCVCSRFFLSVNGQTRGRLITIVLPWVGICLVLLTQNISPGVGNLTKSFRKCQISALRSARPAGLTLIGTPRKADHTFQTLQVFFLILYVAFL